MLHLYQVQLRSLDGNAILKDPKTSLQEYLQARKMNLPSYQVEQTSGKSHNQVFTVSCKLEDLEIESRGKGSSRKKAEQQAAQKILAKLEK